MNTFHINHAGEGETGYPGKEIPEFDWREDFPQFLQHHAGGENTQPAPTEFSAYYRPRIISVV